jgi:intracellular septation protein
LISSILLFVGAYKLYDIYAGTAVLMAATVVQMGLIYRHRPPAADGAKDHPGAGAGVGALTLALHDDRFIKWKPTVLYAAMAIGLAVALWGLEKNFLKLLPGSQLTLADSALAPARPRCGWGTACSWPASTPTWLPSPAPRTGSVSSSRATPSRWPSFSGRASTLPATFRADEPGA